MTSKRRDAWFLDQLAKSELFHKKLHEWKMLEVADKIDGVQGEKSNWDLKRLGISQQSWNKAIHRGIKPVIIFAHPDVLITILHSVSYYRMLAMVSQKSMNQIGLSTVRYEQDECFPELEKANAIAQHLNKIISFLIEADSEINVREFDLWRGMAAGAQAQGSWQNAKGKKTEILIRGLLQRYLLEKNLIINHSLDDTQVELGEGKQIIFSDEPDVAVYQNGKILAAVEIKGGIDIAGVLERVGAAIKSLSRAKEENPKANTILLLTAVSVTPQARNDLLTNHQTVNYWFTVEEVLENEEKQEEFFQLLSLSE